MMTEEVRHLLYKIKPFIQGDDIADSVDLEADGAQHTGLLSNASDQKEVNTRIDRTGLGAQPRTFTGSLFASYGENGNQDIWYGGRQTVMLETERSQGDGIRTFQVPDATELGLAFDDLAANGLSEAYDVTLVHRAGSSSSIVRNALRIENPPISVGFPVGTFPTTVGLGTSARFRIERVAGVIQMWERVEVTAAAEPVATFGEVVLQNVGWNNADFSLLPNAGQVLKGYAFPVTGSDPNDGTLRQGLIDSGVGDRRIYDGDYVIWTADAFTAWTDGDNWLVLSRSDIARMSREASNFLSQVKEIDNRVDVAPVSALTSDALVWVSENPFVTAPFTSPNADTADNPRSGDSYRYIGGTDDRNAQNQFTFGQNRFDSYLTIGITPGFITGHPESDIRVRIYDDDRVLLDDFNLATDFALRDDATFTNATVRHYVRNTSVNYPASATIEIWLTRIAEHFTVDPVTVDLTQNVSGLLEHQLGSDVQEKLNRAIPPAGVTYSSIEDRLLTEGTVTHTTPDIHARFADNDGTGGFPQALSGFIPVSADNPRFTGSDVALFIATPEPGDFTLKNITTSSVLALDPVEATVDEIGSISDSGTTYFVFRVTSLTSGHVYEIDRTTIQNVIVERNQIANLQDDVQRIDAEVDVLQNLVGDGLNGTEVPTDYNKQLAGPANTTQTVFREDSPNPPGGGVLASEGINKTSGDRARRKLVYFPAGTAYTNQAYLSAFDGTVNVDLLRHTDGQFSAQVFVAGSSAGSSDETIYPTPQNEVLNPNEPWFTLETLIRQGNEILPEANEKFLTQNNPADSVTATFYVRGHSNGKLFGETSVTLSGYGGATEVDEVLILTAGSETATVELRWDPSTRSARVAVTESVNSGLPVISDIQFRVEYEETRIIPATPDTIRDVPIEFEHQGVNVFAIKPSPAGNLVLVGNRAEVDTGFAYTALFGATEDGHLTTPVTTGTYFDYEDFEPISSTIIGLENHAIGSRFGLFSTGDLSTVVQDLLARVEALEV